MKMKITKFTHACVRLEHDGGVLVVDPGVWSEPSALAGADAVLVTHEHADHIDVLRLAGLGVPVYAPADAQIDGVPVRGVTAGETFEAGGFRIAAVGGRHAYVHGEQPDCANLGYVVDDSIYHPGDSLYVPRARIETLFVPVHASWLKTTEAIEFVHAVRARRAYPIHDGQINERGLSGTNRWLSQETSGYRYLAPGESA
jgi:L-ascorbate metabolism protein UlaG (beta-lactamase superfamily)